MSDEVRRAVQAFFDGLGSGDWGTPDRMLAALADDATWWIAGTLRQSGTFTKAEMAATLRKVGRIAAGGLAIAPTSWIVEGNRAAVEASATMAMADGTTYANSYHFAFTIEGDRIVAIREHLDTAVLAGMERK